MPHLDPPPRSGHPCLSRTHCLVCPLRQIDIHDIRHAPKFSIGLPAISRNWIESRPLIKSLCGRRRALATAQTGQANAALHLPLGDGRQPRIAMPESSEHMLPPPAQASINSMYTRGGNRAFHNYYNDYSHIADANLRRRLALSDVDKVPFGTCRTCRLRSLKRTRRRGKQESVLTSD